MLGLFAFLLVGMFIGWILKVLFTADNGLDYGWASSLAIVSWFFILMGLQVYTDLNFYHNHSNGLLAFSMASGIFYGVKTPQKDAKSK